MSIDNKLEPFADKNVAAYFHDLDLNSNAKLLYHFKEINFIPDLSILSLF